MSISTLLPLLSAIFVFYLGGFVLLKNLRSKINILFGLLCLSIVIWFIGTFMMFTSKNNVQAEFWDRFVYLGVIFIPILMYHFSLIFTGIKRNILLYLGYFLALAFLILSRTDYFVSGVYEYSWGYHAKAKIFHHIFLLFFSAYLTIFYLNIYKYYKKTTVLIKQLQAKYIFLAFLVLLTGSLAYLPAYGIDVYPSSYLSGLFFAIILGYAVTKYHLMNTRIILTEFLVGLVAFIFLTETVLSRTFSSILFQGGLFFVFCFIGYLLIKSVTNEIKRREELEILKGKLEIANNAKSEFVSIASHQLRTPLTAVKGYISMMIEGTYGKLSQELQKPLQNVYESNEKLIKLVNDLLDLSRLEAGKIEFSPALSSLEKIVSGIIGDLKINADKKGLYLKLIKPKEVLPGIMVDQPKIRQVVLNIIDNAIKYTKDGGVTIRLEKTGSEEQIIISDTGMGITEEEIKNLFQMFSRAASSTKLHTEGSGVGLHVAKKFIEMHQGRIWAESQGRGKGSTFYIELPIKTNEKNSQ